MSFIYRLIFGLTVALILVVAAANLALAGGDVHQAPPPPPLAAPYPPPPPPYYAVPPGHAIAAAWSACNFDVQRYCPMVPPGQGRVVHCLVYNWWGLTPACRAGLRRARAALAY